MCNSGCAPAGCPGLVLRQRRAGAADVRDRRLQPDHSGQHVPPERILAPDHGGRVVRRQREHEGDQIYFNGTAYSTFSSAVNGGSWRIESIIARNGTSSAHVDETDGHGRGIHDNAVSVVEHDGSVNYASTIAFKFTLQGGATSDVIVNSFKGGSSAGDRNGNDMK